MILSHHHPRSVPVRPCDEKFATETPFLSHPYKSSLPQLLSFDVLTNSPGVWRHLAFSRRIDVKTFRYAHALTLALLSIFASRAFHNSFPIKRFRTLSQKRRRGGSTACNSHSGNLSYDAWPNAHFLSPFFSLAYALFQVTYPVSPLLATLTKTAGCISKIPILELVAPASGTPYSRLASVAPRFLRNPLIPFFFPLPVNCRLSTPSSCATL